jgi:hypothetical protein
LAAIAAAGLVAAWSLAACSDGPAGSGESATAAADLAALELGATSGTGPAAADQVANDTQDWLTYTIPNLNLTFAYPPDWTLRPSQGSPSEDLGSYLAAQVTAPASGQGSATVTFEHRAGTDCDPDAAVDLLPSLVGLVPALTTADARPVALWSAQAAQADSTDTATQLYLLPGPVPASYHGPDLYPGQAVVTEGTAFSRWACDLALDLRLGDLTEPDALRVEGSATSPEHTATVAAIMASVKAAGSTGQAADGATEGPDYLPTTDEDTSNWLTFDDPRFPVSFKYQPDWTLGSGVDQATATVTGEGPVCEPAAAEATDDSPEPPDGAGQGDETADGGPLVCRVFVGSPTGSVILVLRYYPVDTVNPAALACSDDQWADNKCLNGLTPSLVRNLEGRTAYTAGAYLGPVAVVRQGPDASGYYANALYLAVADQAGNYSSVIYTASNGGASWSFGATRADGGWAPAPLGIAHNTAVETLASATW